MAEGVGGDVAFTLFVAGSNPLGSVALRNLRRACEPRLPGRYRITLIDVEDDPDAAEEAGIVATPTLVRTSPPPRVRLMGDLSDEAALVRFLGLDPAPEVAR